LGTQMAMMTVTMTDGWFIRHELWRSRRSCIEAYELKLCAAVVIRPVEK
jgi:hypothetical protein